MEKSMFIAKIPWMGNFWLPCLPWWALSSFLAYYLFCFFDLIANLLNVQAFFTTSRESMWCKSLEEPIWAKKYIQCRITPVDKKRSKFTVMILISEIVYQEIEAHVKVIVAMFFHIPCLHQNCDISKENSALHKRGYIYSKEIRLETLYLL